MRQWQFGQSNGSENLELTDVTAPQPGPGQVLVRIRAASLNYRDTLLVKVADGYTPGRVPLSDGAGDVIGVGAGVSRWSIGDRVAGTFFQDWISGRFEMRYHQAALGGTVDGALREEAVFPEHSLVRVPSHYSHEEAATMPCAGVTAWYSLILRCGFQPGDSVLLIGTGGVSVWGLQIAAASGGRPIVVSSSQEKLLKARQLGAAETISSAATPDWDREVFRLTSRRGVDHVLEVGGPGTLKRSLSSVAAGGKIAQIGVLTGFGPSDASLFPLLTKNATMSGIYVGHRDAFEQLVRFVEQTQLRPVIDRVFLFEEAPAAFQYLASGRHFGKVVIRV